MAQTTPLHHGARSGVDASVQVSAVYFEMESSMGDVSSAFDVVTGPVASGLVDLLCGPPSMMDLPSEVIGMIAELV